MSNAIKSPYPFFHDNAGNPLEGGRVYVGVYGLNPIANPQTCYWDKAMIIPATNIRTSGGYMIYNGAPANAYIPGDYSIIVQDKNGGTVYTCFECSIENSDLLLTEQRGALNRSMRTPDTYNMNLILDSGYYAWSAVAGTTNFPASCAAIDSYALTVKASEDAAGFVYQHLIDFTLGPTSAYFTWERVSVDGGATWSAWLVLSVPSGYGAGWQASLALPFTASINLRGHIDGLICSNAADADHDITIAVGAGRDSTNIITLALSAAITKQLDAIWAAGTNAGGMDDGAAIVANSVYYVWLIRKDSDGSIDALFSLSATAPTMPAGYTYKRRIMTVCTDAAANIYPFEQTGDEIKYNSPIFDRLVSAGAVGNTNRNAYTITAPPTMVAIISLTSQLTAGADFYLWHGTSARTNTAASSAYHDYYAYSGSITAEIRQKIDASKQFYVRLSSTNQTLGLVTRGWIDDRGRNA